MKRFRDTGIWLQVQWDLFKRNQSGAQTLEYLGLALLILAVLAVGDSLTKGSGETFAQVLRTKFIEMVKGISTGSGSGSGGTP